jgi:hypothetical protein
MALSIELLTHHPAPPRTTAAIIGHAQSCRRKNRPVAWIREELVNNRESTPEARPGADRDIGELEDETSVRLSARVMATGLCAVDYTPYAPQAVLISVRRRICDSVVSELVGVNRIVSIVRTPCNLE